MDVRWDNNYYSDMLIQISKYTEIGHASFQIFEDEKKFSNG